MLSVPIVIEYVIVTNVFHLNLIIITTILSKDTKRSANLYFFYIII